MNMIQLTVQQLPFSAVSQCQENIKDSQQSQDPTASASMNAWHSMHHMPQSSASVV
jgi:hypothetical protein